MTEPWGPLVRQGARALLEGRFKECERLAGEAARLAPGVAEPTVLLGAARREQGRPAEAEVMVRCLVAEHPHLDEGKALLGAVLADLGRDGEARRQLDALDLSKSSLAVGVLAAETAAALGSGDHAEALYRPLAGRARAFVGCHGAVARHLGLLCHVLGRWDEAEAHFRVALDVNHSAGAPVLVAHTRRHYSALLRARGQDGDWERAIDLLAEAAAIYRCLEIGPLAEQAELVLRRSEDPTPADDAAAVNVFRPAPTGWELAYGGRATVVPDVPGLGHIAALLGAHGRPLHAVDLVGNGLDADAGGRVAAEYRSRLVDLDAQLGSGDPVAAALARAERDFLAAELAVLAAGKPAAGEFGDRARRLVALRIRTCLDRIEAPLPALARHLRRSIRIGTFCVYEPERPERWRVGGP